MATFGNITCSKLTVDKDEVVYKRTAHTDALPDTITLRRTMSSVDKKTLVRSPTRANARFERQFTVGTDATRPGTVSIATVVPPGVDPVAWKAYVLECLTQAAAEMQDRSLTGDIYVDE